MTLYPLFETLCIEQGKIQNLALHQARYGRSLNQFYGAQAFCERDLEAEIKKNPQFSTALQSPLCRCRVAYNHHQLQIAFFPYQRKIYRHFQPVIADDIEYALKFQDRQTLNALVAQNANADEILIIRHHKVTDCSIGNLVFRRGKHWFTPDQPLLQGTQRQFLLQQGKIEPCPIFAEEIDSFDEIRLINAMNPLVM